MRRCVFLLQVTNSVKQIKIVQRGQRSIIPPANENISLALRCSCNASHSEVRTYIELNATKERKKDDEWHGGSGECVRARARKKECAKVFIGDDKIGSPSIFCVVRVGRTAIWRCANNVCANDFQNTFRMHPMRDLHSCNVLVHRMDFSLLHKALAVSAHA